MKGRNSLFMLGLDGKGSSIVALRDKNALDQANSQDDIGVSLCDVKTDARPFNLKVVQRSSNSSDFLTASQVADLLHCHVTTVRRNCASGKFPNAITDTMNGGEGWLIPLTSLSKPAQKAYAKQRAAAILEKTKTFDVATLSPQSTLPDAEYSELWERYECKSRNFKEKARQRLVILLAYHELLQTGISIGDAEAAIKDSHGAARSTIHRFLASTKGHPRQHWEPLLVPNYHGGRLRSEFTPAAYECIKALKIKSPASSLRLLIRTAQKEGADKGWIFPGEDTIANRLKEEPAWVFQTREQRERGFPTVERDYSRLALHELWDSDGRKADVWCEWPDGTINRPFVIAIREVRSRRVLSIRVCHAPDTEAVMGAFGSAMERANAIPNNLHIDNGREYANKAFTGQQRSRYRFKYKTDEASGILTVMDVKAIWSKPGQGRGKAIESWWNVIADNCDRSPEFSGAYCGHNPLAKPEDFDKRHAIPVAVYAAKLIEIVAEYEKGCYGGHRGQGMNGKTVLEVYEELAAKTAVRQPTTSEIRRCRMGVKSLKLDKKDATIRFAIEGFLPRRYWHEALANLPSIKRDRHFNVHYEWANPDAPVSIYCGDEFICDAMPINSIPYLDHDGEQVRQHMAEKNAYLKPRERYIRSMKTRVANILPTEITEEKLSLPPIRKDAEIIIAPSKKHPLQEQAPLSLQLRAGSKDEYQSTKTGAIYKNKEQETLDQLAKEQTVAEARQARLDELARKKLEKDLANLKAG